MEKTYTAEFAKKIIARRLGHELPDSFELNRDVSEYDIDVFTRAFQGADHIAEMFENESNEQQVKSHEWQTNSNTQLADAICTLTNARLKGHMTDVNMIDEIRGLVGE